MIFRIVFILILLVFRFYHLDARPPHHDEAVNGWFVDGIFKNGFYQYDPANYHGPLYFYVLTLFEKIFGRSIEVLRTPTILFAGAMTFTPLLFKKWISERGAWIATFFLAVSPAMVFYSRYAIHEMSFALFSILFFYYWIRVRTEGFTQKLIWGLGLCLGALACLKENFVIYVACLGVAEFCLWAAGRLFPTGLKEPPAIAFQNRKKAWTGVAAVLGIAFALVLIFYSALGRDPNGIKNFFKAFVLWSETGEKGNGHQKPFFYWLKLMGTLEWFSLLGLALVPFALKKVSREIRLLSILGFGMWLAYSIVNYKTPWCVLSYYWALIFVAAYWVSRLMENKNWRPVLFMGLLAGDAVSAYQAYDVAYVNVDADDHLYIYGQTFHEFMVPMNEILERVKENPNLKKTLRIQIISSFTWPMPWIFGEIEQVGYYGEANAPAVLDADYIIIDHAFEPKFTPNIHGNYSRVEVRSRQWASTVAIFRKN